MFSLIITIVSIALVVALVAATMYHGGDTLTQGRTTADAAAFVSGAQQIGGAQVMHLSLLSTEAADVAALVAADFLASAPVVKGAAWTISTADNTVNSVVETDAVCTQINTTAGYADPAAVTAIASDKPYGCINGTKAFSFKY